MSQASKSKTTRSKTKSKAKAGKTPQTGPIRRVLRWAARGALAIFAFFVLAVLLLNWVNPPTNLYMMSESRRLGGVKQEWVALTQINPAMARSVVAAEDANFCNHWGFDLPAIKAAIEAGSNRGASTITQQTVKNVLLWHGRTWIRKALEAGLTPLVEAIWSKRRIIEVYLNVAEFDEGVFGVKAAADHYFGVTPDRLSDAQAARLAAILPAPKTRSASDPSATTRKRAASIQDGAATIRADGRSACFES
ncbi:Biosynthetic peptidoglycan transglycosylase (plasmid) [Pseudoseohaeicola sp. NH-UV-7]|uniref:monofunctional biosynthetic peptidoglycan transglycosylase n=1 Tax=unclassified Sulfitobacter TaxID=196795 RepID=UPI000E0B74FB|nr:monofunctional biosynthetic peptidoglycan transglycosylase [Sulfitobacter sp. JL08]AXI56448.1 monofunctional biosynthetic peptidoglycan transglycosylase [Sulfitobacter sp. JL08]